jgi:alpha/beta superfamily hydrolase
MYKNIENVQVSHKNRIVTINDAKHFFLGSKKKFTVWTQNFTKVFFSENPK